jgi:hypothetical protein
VGCIVGGNIYEFTPDGEQSTFASGLYPIGLVFNSAGDLFATGDGNIYKFSPSGVRSTFASGLPGVGVLAFNSADDLFALDSGNMYEFTPDGTQSTFASGLDPVGMAFQGETLPVPEPSALGLLAVGATALLARRRRIQLN